MIETIELHLNNSRLCITIKKSAIIAICTNNETGTGRGTVVYMWGMTGFSAAIHVVESYEDVRVLWLGSNLNLLE